MGRVAELWMSRLDAILCRLEEGSMSAAEFSSEAKRLGLSDFDIVTHIGNLHSEPENARF